MIRNFATLPALAALLLAGACTTGPSGTEVTRFHLGQPIARSSIVLVAADPARRDSLEFRSFADAVASELRAQSFTPVAVDAPDVAYVGTITISQGSRPAPPKGGLTIGLGGGSFGRGGGVGGGVSFPVGQSRPGEIVATTLALQIKRHSDGSVIWEGRATGLTDTRGAVDPGAAVPKLARALLSGFPGPAGQTVRVP